jgi:hypothetical protein
MAGGSFILKEDRGLISPPEILDRTLRGVRGRNDAYLGVTVVHGTKEEWP